MWTLLNPLRIFNVLAFLSLQKMERIYHRKLKLIFERKKYFKVKASPVKVILSCISNCYVEVQTCK